MTDVEFEMSSEDEPDPDTDRPQRRFVRALSIGGLLGLAGWVVVIVLLWAIFHH